MTQTLKIPSTAIEYPIFSPNWGPDLDKPKELLLDTVSPYSRNMQVVEGKVQGRLGLGKLLDVALSGAVISQPRLKSLAGTRYYLFCTPKDIYSLDYSNSRYDILTPTYTTGTITISAGDLKAVVGSGTSWDGELAAGDYIKIGSGSVHTGSTWYEIDTVTDDTHLTLVTDAVECSGSAYVAREIFGGSNSNYWDWAIFDDDNLGRIVVMTNGTDTPVYWTGSNQVVAFPTLPTGFTAAKYVNVFKNRIIFGWCVMGGANQRQRLFWSGVADITSWLDTDFIDISDEPSDITGMTLFSGYHVAFKEDTAYVGRFIGGDEVFAWDEGIGCVGTLSAQSIVTKRKQFIEYYGNDKKIHRWTLLKDEIITEMIYPETREFDPNTHQYVHGYDVGRYNETRFFCPYGDTDTHNYVIVSNYKYQDIKVWAYADANACCSMGNFIITSDVYADDAVFGALYADQTPGYADDVTFLSNSEIVLYGGYDGYVRIADSGVNDDGTAYTRLLRFKPLNFDKHPAIQAMQVKRLQSQVYWLEQAQSGTVTVKMKTDNSSSYLSDTKSISLAPEGDEEVVKEKVVWDKHAIAFQPELSATNFFALLGFFNYLYPKGFGRG